MNRPIEEIYRAICQAMADLYEREDCPPAITEIITKFVVEVHRQLKRATSESVAFLGMESCAKVEPVGAGVNTTTQATLSLVAPRTLPDSLEIERAITRRG